MPVLFCRIHPSSFCLPAYSWPDALAWDIFKPAVNLLDSNYLFASLIWGSVGAGYCIYGRRQRSVVPFVGGVGMIALSYFVSSALWMSLVCIALMVAIRFLVRRGY